ncbi:hypothetical protein L202_03198 [Cryptococcus amylolentus CBS 6039]|uniref:Amino acid permease/ SLC12A domain-containing protein n=1 Tax=Cryptococcus amylolentus CBS 6039 TaxID=1295533 RepID=A0A1E3HXQ1_9TREE|nr:hypothetical protein L202_03198 [Cryptococcus amylolentus CBS 6039]ODN81104.1 hypothetical protein L202_03198 [Cryptococcus amylolentus CBS 6039]
MIWNSTVFDLAASRNRRCRPSQFYHSSSLESGPQATHHPPPPAQRTTEKTKDQHVKKKKPTWTFPQTLVEHPAIPYLYGQESRFKNTQIHEKTWTTTLVAWVLMVITAAVLAEICSALPLSGSIYIWASESAGKKYARLVGYIVAWWACTAWMTFVASVCQTTANFLLSLFTLYSSSLTSTFPEGTLTTDNVKFRAVQWALAEGILVCCVAMNYLPQRLYKWVFRGSMGLMMVDALLNLIWLPIGVHNSYGFRSAREVFLAYNNGTGAPQGWNYMLGFIFGSASVIGFDAAGHISEETHNASTRSARGILLSALASGFSQFILSILFLFCLPPLDVYTAFGAQQPFVQVYDLALGRGGAVFMTSLATLGLMLNCSITIVASSRLVFAVARDGVLPFSSWVGRVTEDGRPKNAVTVIALFAGLLLCTILPSGAAFTSLISAAATPTISAYVLIAFCRLFVTPDGFKNSKMGLGGLAKPFYVITIVWNLVLFAVLISPFYLPTSASIFNYSIVIWGAVTIFGFISWLVTSPETWLHQERVERMKEAAGGGGGEEEKRSRFGEVQEGKKDVVGENVGIGGA